MGLTSPGPIPLKKKRRRLPTHKTRRGRVVYDRKKHVFKLSDAKRILQNILMDNNVPSSSFYSDWSDMMVFLLVMFAKSVALPLAIDAALAVVNFVVTLFTAYPQLISTVGGLLGKDKEPQ